MPFIHSAGRMLLYLHVPKTGGGTIEEWLKTVAPIRFYTVGVPTAMRCTPQHLRMTDYHSLFGPAFFDHVVMTVRNPYARIESEYRMRAEISGKDFWKAYPSFSLWLEQSLSIFANNPFYLDNHLRPQWEFHGSDVEILKYEDGLSSITARIAEILQVNAPQVVGRVHDTSMSNVTVQWDLSDRLRVQDVYRRDFELFGYDM